MNYETTMSATLDDEILQDDRDRNQRRMRIAGIIVAILTIAGAAYYFFGSGNTAPTDADKAGQAQTVTVVAPGRDSVARTINATGTLAARREIPVGIVGEGGRVLMVYVDAGDWVTQGQVLVSVDRSVQTQQAAALEAQTDFAALTPEAQAFARGALEAGPWRLGLDSTRVHLSDGRTLACSFETTGDDAVVVTVDDAVLLRLRRTGPRTMRTEGDLPLVRAE